MNWNLICPHCATRAVRCSSPSWHDSYARPKCGACGERVYICYCGLIPETALPTKPPSFFGWPTEEVLNADA